MLRTIYGCKIMTMRYRWAVWEQGLALLQKAGAHHACCCSSPRSLQLLDKILQLLPFNVTISCGQTREAELVWYVFALVLIGNDGVKPEPRHTATHTLHDLCTTVKKRAPLGETKAEKVPYISCQIGIYQRPGEIVETGDPCSWCVGSLMSVLSKRVKVGSQIDAYWSVLSLCRAPNFNTTGKYALYHRWFPPGSPNLSFWPLSHKTWE